MHATVVSLAGQTEWAGATEPDKARVRGLAVEAAAIGPEGPIVVVARRADVWEVIALPAP